MMLRQKMRVEVQIKHSADRVCFRCTLESGACHEYRVVMSPLQYINVAERMVQMQCCLY